MAQPIKKTVVYYVVADLDHPMRHTDIFKTLEEAQAVLNKKHTGSSADYWNERRNGIIKVTKTSEVIESNKGDLVPKYYLGW